MFLFLIFSLFLAYSSFTLGLIYFQGFHFEGLPQGTYYQNRDVTGLHYRSLKNMVEDSLNTFDKTLIELNLDDSKYILRNGREFKVKVDDKDLLKHYRKLKKSRPWYQKIKNHFKLDFEVQKFPPGFLLDEDFTKKRLGKILNEHQTTVYRLVGEHILKSDTRVNEASLYEDLKNLISTGKRGLLPLKAHLEVDSIQMKWSPESSQKLVFELVQDFEKGSRGYSLITSVLSSQVSFLINPGDEFSFHSFMEGTNVKPGEYELEMQEVDGLEVRDYYGLNRLSSLFYEAMITLGFHVKEHEFHQSLFPGLTYLKAGRDSYLSSDQDLRMEHKGEYPYWFFIDLSENHLALRVYSIQEMPYEFILREGMRNLEYGDVVSLVDPALEKGEKKILRQPVPGVRIQLDRLIRLSGKVVEQEKLISNYEPIEGLIAVGEEGLNILDTPIDWHENLRESFFQN